jgi:II/X family phage/plasmid replication protein
MIDWLTLKIRTVHPAIRAGTFMSVDANGAIEYETPKASSVVGSFSSSMRFRSTGAMTDNSNEFNDELSISGNPAKWLQGHNIFGCEDGVKMISEVLKRLPPEMGLGYVSEFAVRSAIVSRIDFTKSLQFENLIQCRSFIREVGLRARTRSGRPVLQGSTVGFQKGSGRWNLVVYAKGDEVRVHELPEELPNRDKLIQEAQRLVRVELRLRGRELYDRDLRALCQLSPPKLNQLYTEYLERIEMSTVTKLPNDLVMALSPHHRSTYLLWMTGLDVISTMTIPTFYRHRSGLIKYGVDISIPRDCEGPNVVPLHKVISGQPYVSPEWADGTSLKFGS